ncbi:hypothetical protein [Roseicella aerolata]|uniref:Uncharacterized protein n=1 Tax=Roseicella aerolata TaxID=2883479 RepID=A0A9X1IG49_9PROT|nr:hypothetical protein [Roseicella aerolata]MCB4823068.1 hypothetical protein [Roseicella aerolata]
MPKTTIAAAALLGVLAASGGAHAQGTGQQPTPGQAQQVPGAQMPMPGMQGGGMMQQGMPMMQGQGGMMMAGCPMMQRMASLDGRVRRLEERAGIPVPAQPGGAAGAAPGSAPTR